MSLFEMQNFSVKASWHFNFHHRQRMCVCVCATGARRTKSVIIFKVITMHIEWSSLDKALTLCPEKAYVMHYRKQLPKNLYHGMLLFHAKIIICFISCFSCLFTDSENKIRTFFDIAIYLYMWIYKLMQIL